MAPPLPGFDQAVLDQCVGCGLCLPACPTYQVLGQEMDSPRGRIDFVRNVAEGRLEPTDGIVGHLDRCLDCRACESACPSGVQYGRIIEDARALLPRPSTESRVGRLLRTIALRALLPSRGALGALGRLLGLVRATGLDRLAQTVLAAPWARRLAPRLAWAVQLFPRARGRPFRPTATVFPPAAGAPPPSRGAAGPARHPPRVAMFRGCVQDVLFGDVQRATITALTAAGCEVVIPPGQTCCGALLLHGGDRRAAERLLARNVSAFAGTTGRAGGPFDAIVVNAAGCGSVLAEAGELLGTPAAHRFAGAIRDVTEVLADLDAADDADVAGRDTLSDEEPPPERRRVAYQDPCHLRHARGVRTAPRSVLGRLPGVDLCEPAGVDTCCGSAGIYNLLQPEISRALTERKVDAILATGASVVVSGNPGCLLQLEAGLNARAGAAAPSVLHPVELIAAGARARAAGTASGRPS